MSHLSAPAAWTTLINLVDRVPQAGPEIEAAFKTALVSARSSLSPTDPDLARVEMYVADFYLTKGRYAEAEALYRQALVIYNKRYGFYHMLVGMVMRNLAMIKELTGQKQHAEVLLSQARWMLR
jgi:Flp pilus assembly protein TadD